MKIFVSSIDGKNIIILLLSLLFWDFCKAELQQSFSTCVYCTRLRFQSYYTGFRNQGNYFENANACSKRTLKTTVATQLLCCKNQRNTHLNNILKLIYFPLYFDLNRIISVSVFSFYYYYKQTIIFKSQSFHYKYDYDELNVTFMISLQCAWYNKITHLIWFEMIIVFKKVHLFIPLMLIFLGLSCILSSISSTF